MIAQGAAAVPEIAKWFENSIVTGVVIALLVGYFIFGKRVLEKFEAVAKAQKESIESINEKHELSLNQAREIHREERGEWRAISNEREKQITEVCKQVVDGFNEFKTSNEIVKETLKEIKNK